MPSAAEIIGAKLGQLQALDSTLQSHHVKIDPLLSDVPGNRERVALFQSVGIADELREIRDQILKPRNRGSVRLWSPLEIEGDYISPRTKPRKVDCRLIWEGDHKRGIIPGRIIVEARLAGEHYHRYELELEGGFYTKWEVVETIKEGRPITATSTSVVRPKGPDLQRKLTDLGVIDAQGIVTTDHLILIGNEIYPVLPEDKDEISRAIADAFIDPIRNPGCNSLISLNMWGTAGDPDFSEGGE